MSDVEPEMPVDEDANADKNGECFVIAPIGDPRTETRRQTDGLLSEAIRPVIEDDLGLEVTAAHELPEAGSITRQVLQHLLEAELVVADLTNLNANVMYELAVRHAKGRPVVPIAERGTSLPFDITTERTIFYEEDFHGLSELKPKLEEAAQAALKDKEPDNPIYRAQQDFQMREAVADDDAMGYVMDRLDEIESAIRSGEAKLSEGPIPAPPPNTICYLVDGTRSELENFRTIFSELYERLAPPQLYSWKFKEIDQGALIFVNCEAGFGDQARNLIHQTADEVGSEIKEPTESDLKKFGFDL